MNIDKAVNSAPTESSTQLREGALSFGAVLMQAITHIAPAAGLLLTIQFTAASAGIAAPSTYAAAFLIVLTLGIPLAQLAKHHPSAGGYYTYVSRTVHPRAGFLTAWLYFLYDPAATALNLAFLSYFFETVLRVEYQITVHWWALFLPSALLIGWLVYRGIEISVDIMIWLSVIEIAISLALAAAGLIHPGPGGITYRSFVPTEAPNRSGLYLGIVFSIFAFTGFESVAPLAEETQNAKRNLPLSIIISILLMGLFFVFCDWGLLVGWGTKDLAAFAHAPENPTLILAKRLWGKAWILVCIAVFNSILGVSIAATNAASRVFYAMARSGVLPSPLSAIHPKFRTPANAIFLQTALTLSIGLGLGAWMGPEDEYAFLGILMTLGLIFVYSFGNLGVWLYYRRHRPDELNVWLHFVFPLFSTISLLGVGYSAVVPLPAPPIRYAAPVVLVWLVVGAIFSVLPRVNTPETQ